MIKDVLNLIDDQLSKTYINLQKLQYEEDIENYVRNRLTEITDITKDILEFIYIQDQKQQKRK